MSKITYIVSSTGKQNLTFGSTSISTTSFNVPITIEEDGTDDILLNASITAGLLVLISATPVSLPQQNVGHLTTAEATVLKSLVGGGGNLGSVAVSGTPPPDRFLLLATPPTLPGAL